MNIKSGLALIACGTAAVVATACSSAPPASSAHARTPAVLSDRPAPAGWLRATLRGGGAVLAYPPSMRLISGDKGTITAARITASGRYLLYLNVTPRQGAETLSDWAEFRLDHQREEEITSVREVSDQPRVRFLGGTGSCVTDAYVTKAGPNHYTEIACYVQGRTSASVIVAAAPTADWASASGVLRRAIAGFVVH